jgi:hypothetical protein
MLGRSAIPVSGPQRNSTSEPPDQESWDERNNSGMRFDMNEPLGDKPSTLKQNLAEEKCEHE